MAYDLNRHQFANKYDTFDSFDEHGILESLEAQPLREATILLKEAKNELSDVPESHLHNANLFSSMNALRALSGRKRVQQHNVKGIIFPWSARYRAWWWFTVMGAAVTMFFETFQIAFSSSALNYPFRGQHYTLEYTLATIFFTDIIISFDLAYYNERDEIIFDRKDIAKNYLSCRFWVDFLAVFPFQFCALLVTDQLGQETQSTQILALFRLLRLLRTYRIRDLFEILQYDTRVSLFGLTMIRNFTAALVWTHMAACMLYFISRQAFMEGADTFLKDQFIELDEFDSYVTSLYWSVVTFATVGYGDFAPANSAEQIWTIFYMMSNIVIQAWIIGSITLLLIKKDEKTGNYRDTLETLDQYSRIHSFDDVFQRRLKAQVQLEFNTREIADESVLRFFPTSMRRKVLRRLYTPYLVNTELMQGVRQQFVDAFLASCVVEIFSPGEEILRRNAISSDLYLLVGGVVRYVSSSNTTTDDTHSIRDTIEVHDDDLQQNAGDFINEVGFFTESPQIDTVVTVTVCKTLTISRSAYKMLAQDHPGSSGKILQNLLEKVQDMEAAFGAPVKSNIPVALGYLRAGSSYYQRSDSFPDYRKVRSSSALTAIEDLVKMHIEKQKDDHTTRFLFAASRGDTNTISVMCDQGFDPDCSDYDSRTALMVAAMKGNTEVVTKLLRYNADPNLVDMHGSSALYEAARNGHEKTMEVLLENGAELCMPDSLAASVLDQAVFDGDILLLRRLLQSKIQVNAVDYDKRGAVHLAAAEGNLAALKLMVDYGADLTVKDRWGNSIKDEAKRAKAGKLLEFLNSIDQN